MLFPLTSQQQPQPRGRDIAGWRCFETWPPGGSGDHSAKGVCPSSAPRSALL